MARRANLKGTGGARQRSLGWEYLTGRLGELLETTKLNLEGLGYPWNRWLTAVYIVCGLVYSLESERMNDCLATREPESVAPQQDLLGILPAQFCVRSLWASGNTDTRKSSVNVAPQSATEAHNVMIEGRIMQQGRVNMLGPC